MRVSLLGNNSRYMFLIIKTLSSIKIFAEIKYIEEYLLRTFFVLSTREEFVCETGGIIYEANSNF
jgi:hypothetical protein